MYGHIFHNVRRPEPRLLEAFATLPTATISDALGRHGALNMSISPLYQDISMTGCAMTVLCFPGDNIMTHRALQMIQPGDVLVIDDGDHETGCFGHRSAMLAKSLGGAGAVMNGSVRDAKELRAERFPIFCRGVSPRAPQKNTPGSINVPVTVGGIVIMPGDIVVGDDDGVVVVPLASAEEILAKARARDDRERSSHLKSGELPLDPAGAALDLDRMLEGKVVHHHEPAHWGPEKD